MLPTVELEQSLIRDGVSHIAGVDEVGRGALAGPVVAVAVILPRENPPAFLETANDSKKLPAAFRESFMDQITSHSIEYGVGACSSLTIDLLGIAKATEQAMIAAIGNLATAPQHILVDGRPIGSLKMAQTAIVRGDSISRSIACASIVAKVYRDRLMASEFDSDYPEYNFAAHKGYGTREHLERIERHGPSPIHRRSFKPINAR